MIALADTLVKHNHDVVKAVNAWQPAQLAYGNQLLQYGQMLGDRSQFRYGTGREA